MDLNNMKTLISRGITLVVILLLALLVASPASAKSFGKDLVDNMYIVELIDPPLVYFDGDNNLLSAKVGKSELRATSPRATGAKRLDVHTKDGIQYSRFLDERFNSLQSQFEQETGIKIEAKFRYRNLMNGFAAEMSTETAELIRNMPGVKSVIQDYKEYPLTYAGPEWIGAGSIWTGEGPLPETMGEGMVVGIIDTGINVEHQSFAAIGDDGYTHTNPLGAYLGQCDQPDVNCNDKVIGVYNFTDDDTNGIDDNGHGSHVASTAAGNVINNLLKNVDGRNYLYNISGVAPHANIISYKICREDDESTPDDDEGGCQGSAILQALDQVVTDGVDAVNYSIGAGFQPSPWSNDTSQQFLALRAAGIFAATSAGNSGPGPSTVGSPANAPWITTVASASHDGVTATMLADMSGGNTAAPADMVSASKTPGITMKDIVYAGDFGNALCGEGPSESAAACVDNTGASAPSNWGPQTFAGKIVVCDRGDYGRVEKGKNVLLSGAVGYILINTAATGESTVADDHCLPAGHIGAQKGAVLRNWLTSGSGHRAKINGAAPRKNSAGADVLANSSSRGPLGNPDGVLKPDVMAPGRSILAAYYRNPNDYVFLGGTSMASPHVAGAGALVKAINPSWGPDQIASALVLSASMELAKDSDFSLANFHESGAGRVQTDQAALSGLYLAVSASDFEDANPAAPTNGDPRQLNLSTITDPSCKASCEFTRRVTDSMGGGNWSVSVEGDADISVTPSQFVLGNGASRTLTISVDTSSPSSFGVWNYGTVVLTNTNGNAPDARIPLAVFGYLGELPTEIVIDTRFSSGTQMETIDGLIGLPNGEFTAAGLAKPNKTTAAITEDPTNDDPFNGDGGNIVEFFEVTADTFSIRATITDTAAPDMDLFIGRDSNGNGIPESSEIVCVSADSGSDEHCDILLPQAGQWWVMMQAWTNPNTAEATLSYATINTGDDATLIATGPAILAQDATGKLRVSWQNVQAVTGDELWGAIAVGTDPANPQNIGIIPVIYSRFGEADLQKSVILGNDSPASFTLRSGNIHKRLVFDVPPGGGSVEFSLTAEDPADNSDLRIQIYRMTFPNAFNDAPSVTLMPDGLGSKGQDAGGASGPSVTVSGGALNPGRYYIAAENTGGNSIAVTARAVYQGASARVEPRTGLWGDGSYGAAGAQGFEYAEVNGVWFGIWYTYNEDGTPTWYFINSGALAPMGNSHTVDILEFTNNPNVNPPTQKFTVVGKATFTAISETDMKISYILNGEYGGSSAVPLSSNTCEMIDGNPAPITGTWAPDINIAGGIGGSSVEYGNSKTLIHYIYDDNGEPRWVISGGNASPAPAREAWEFRGYCPTCSFVQPTYTTVGTITQTYSSATAGSQILDFTLQAPNNSVFDRTMDVFRLSGAIECQ